MAIRPVPDGYTAVTPWLISSDTHRLIEYVTRAFGATELSRLTGPDGRLLRLGPELGAGWAQG